MNVDNANRVEGESATGDRSTEYADPALEKFLKADRQWPRHLRIAHASCQLRNAPTEKLRSFWRAVIRRNGQQTLISDHQSDLSACKAELVQES